MKIIFGKKLKKFFVVSLCPVEVYEFILISKIKKKDVILYDGYDEILKLKTAHLRFGKFPFRFIGSSEEDKNNLNLFLEMLKKSKNISFLKKKKGIQIHVSL